MAYHELTERIWNANPSLGIPTKASVDKEVREWLFDKLSIACEKYDGFPCELDKIFGCDFANNPWNKWKPIVADILSKAGSGPGLSESVEEPKDGHCSKHGKDHLGECYDCWGFPISASWLLVLIKCDRSHGEDFISLSE